MSYKVVKEAKKGNVKPMTYTEIAEALGVSRQSVKNIERRALWKLKRSGKLDQFLCLLDIEVKQYYGEESRRIKQCE